MLNYHDMKGYICHECSHTDILNDFFCNHAIPSDLLRSPRLPTHLEKVQAQELIRFDEKEFERCSEMMRRLQETYKTLEIRTHAISRRMAERRSWIAPVRKLPVEVLELVFSYMVDTSYMFTVAGRGRITDAPLFFVAHVCFLWRNIVLHRRKWWASIQVDIASMTRDITPILDSFFHRSAGHPLTIRIIDMHKCHERPRTKGCRSRPRLKRLVYKRLLEGQAKQTECLVLDTFDCTIRDSFMKSTITYPILRTLIFNESAVRVPVQASFYGGFSVTPQLSRVTMSYPSRSDVLPFRQITFLQIRGLAASQLQDWLRILSLCTNLRSLLIDETPKPPPFSTILSLSTLPGDIIVLPSLQFFRLGPTNAGIAMLLGLMSFPRLVSVEIISRPQNDDGTIRQPEAWPDSLPDLLRRSGAVSSLAVKVEPSCSVDLASFVQLLGVCPELRTLTVDVGDQMKSALAAFQKSRVCPRLFRLRVPQHQIHAAVDIVKFSRRIYSSGCYFIDSMSTNIEVEALYL